VEEYIKPLPLGTYMDKLRIATVPLLLSETVKKPVNVPTPAPLIVTAWLMTNSPDP
jgi:hypothetical protein